MPVVQTQAVPSSLDELQKALAKVQEEANELLINQAKNKREATSLTQAIGVIDKSLAEYKKSGEKLRADFDHAKKQIHQKLKCPAHHLGDHKAAVDAAIAAVSKRISESETSLVETEEELTAPLEWEARQAAREAMKAKRAFELLRVGDLQAQLAKAQAFEKNADAITGTSLPESAAAYAWLIFAGNALAYQWLDADYLSEQKDFAFPKSYQEYETRLIAAYEAMDEAAETALDKQAAFLSAKTGFEADKKVLTALRASRDNDAVDAAKAAVLTSPSKPTTSPEVQQATTETTQRDKYETTQRDKSEKAG